MSMSAQTDKMSIVEFLTTERGRLIRYVRHLIDDAAERDGEDIVQDVALNRVDGSLLATLEIQESPG